MILELFAILVLLSIAFVFMGYYMGADLFRIIGFTFIFILGMAFMIGGLDYKSGNEIVQSGDTTSVTYEYDNYTNQTIAFFLTISGILGVTLVMIERREDHDD